ncbi:hypothetical protein HZA42_00930 [Candidatus Peregrinibacteria bacterium]|nr:hypothetical protein [Candidatus Peregrinibacteria bacterium]
MKYGNPKNLTHRENEALFWTASRFVYLDAAGGTTPAGAPTGADQNEETQEATALNELVRRQRQRQQNQGAVDNLNVDEDLKQKLHEALFSDSMERQNLVTQFLENKDRAAFMRQVDAAEAQDRSWEGIFHIQRDIRARIQNLQYRAESYVELIPRKKADFELLIKEARKLNMRDAAADRGLRAELYELTQPDAQRQRHPVLQPHEADDLYNADPRSVNFNTIMNRYRSRIENAPNWTDGKARFRKIVARKKEEAGIEIQFESLSVDFDKILQNNLSKVRRKAEQERILKIAGKAVGITIKPGTEIRFKDPQNLDVSGDAQSVKIAAVAWDDVVVRNSKGEVIDKTLKAPIIVLGNGAKMTLGRFKKWVDGADAVPVTPDLAAATQALGLADYGIKIEKGMMLSYMRRSVTPEGEILSNPVFVTITNINEHGVHFDRPVLFSPGTEGGEEEMRDTLELGEFVKWWRRYEVMKSMGLEELQKMLKKYNEVYNHDHGLSPGENPPILVEKGEELQYPDEEGQKFNIVDVDMEGISLNGGIKYTFPEFFYWVSNNCVERTPEQKKSPEQEKAAAEKAQGMLEDIDTKKELKEKYVHAAEAHMHRVDARTKEVGSLTSRLADLWWSTQILSLRDLWDMVMEVVEFVKRKHTRRAKGRYGEVGSRIPGQLGVEFDRARQAVMDEEVNKYKEPMEKWGVDKIRRILYKTNSRDEAKACILTLTHKGEMRWDDHRFWETMNRITQRHTLRGSELHIPSPDEMPPGQSGEDMVIKSIDAVWGQSMGSEWFMENTGKYNSNKHGFEFKFKQLENDPKGIGGPKGELQAMIAAWKQGEYVNAQEYEAMIDGAIKFGKMGAEDKMFFIMAGIVARQGEDKGVEGGETLLHIDRAGELNSQYLNVFPLLDFFTQEKVVDYTQIESDTSSDNYGKPGKKRKLQLRDYERFVHTYFPEDFDENKAGKQFSRFMWEVMLMADSVRTRISKGIRNAENMDHDDAHLYIPPTTAGEIDSLTTGPTGQKKYFTNAGYCNAYPGFNQYILSLSSAYEEEADESKKKDRITALRDAVGAFIRLDAILDNRLLKKEGDHRARLDKTHYERGCVVDSTVKLEVYQKQMRNLVMEIGKAYGQDWHTWLYGAKTRPGEDEKQAAYERKIENLKEEIPKLFEQDGGQKALEVVNRFRDRATTSSTDLFALRALPGSERPRAAELKELHARARVWELAEAAKLAHGGH